MDEFIKIFEPVDRLHQSRNISYNRAMPMIQILQSTISDYRTDEHFTEYKRIADELCPMYSDTNRARNCRRSTLLDEFVVESTIGERSNEFNYFLFIKFYLFFTSIIQNFNSNVRNGTTNDI